MEIGEFLRSPEKFAQAEAKFPVGCAGAEKAAQRQEKLCK